MWPPLIPDSHGLGTSHQARRPALGQGLLRAARKQALTMDCRSCRKVMCLLAGVIVERSQENSQIQFEYEEAPRVDGSFREWPVGWLQ